MKRTYPFDEWRVAIPGAGPWASGSWDRCCATEKEARIAAEREGGRAYLQRWIAPGVKAEGQLL